ncbi:flagellar FliJ family protein [Specibacter sp. RAF43]|uniref:flagellar FliJ family protein n=1 Tax=Specibacter sp. RAF43 TaxID=3233057 RepID=UPI003F9DE214
MTKTFRLAGLLRYRKLQEDQASAGLARANDRRNSHGRRVAGARRDLAETAAEVSSAAALTAAAAARSASRSLLLELQSLATSLDAEAACAQAALVEAKTAANSLEKLAERHELASNAAELLDEQKFLDELALAQRKGLE